MNKKQLRRLEAMYRKQERAIIAARREAIRIWKREMKKLGKKGGK